METLDYLAVASIGDATDLLLGALVSAVSAYLCIHYFLKLLDTISMLPFVIYRLCLGVFLLVLFL